MKIAKKIFIALALIVLIPFVLALFSQKDYHVEREISINKNKTEVFEYVKYLRNQDEYSKWSKMDPNIRKSFRGTDATVGFVSAWESDMEDVGSGEQEITKIIEGERIEMELRFFTPFEATEPAYMSTEATNGSTTLVKWGFYGHMDYPMNMMLWFMDMETMIGNDLDEGLVNLKKILEKE